MRYTPLIRLVERYFGSFLCFVFSLLHALRRRPKDTRIRNVLIIELVEMGAAVMAYSSLQYIRTHVPDAQIHCLCLDSKKESWLLIDAIPEGNVHVIDDSSLLRFIPSLLRQVRMLSKKKIDLIIDLELFLRISAIIAFLIRAKFRAGFYRYTMEGMYRGDFFDVRCNFNQNMHISKNLLALTKSAVGLSPHYYNYQGPIPTSALSVPSYRSDPELSSRVRAKLDALSQKRGPLICIAPTVGAALPMRDYPKGHYEEVIRRLLTAHPKHRIVLVGTEEHEPVCAGIARDIGDARCINFTGRTSLRELVELFVMSDLLISNDSGNPHFAALAGLPTLAIFGPETPFVYGPLGKAVCLYSFFHSSPSITAYNHKNPPNGSDMCLRSIEPQTVADMARLILAGKAVYGTVNNEIAYLV